MPAARHRVAFLLLAVLAAPAGAQSTRQVDGADRLFDRFVEDAAVVPGGWLEGRLRFAKFERGERWGLGPVVAFNVAQDFEFGFSFQGLSVDPDDADAQTGLSDLRAWGKGMVLEGTFVLTVGGAVTFPTGDEDQGLGTGEVDAEAFAAIRRSWDTVTLVASGGLRLNQDPDAPLGNGGFPADAGGPGEGEVSALGGLGLIFPLGEGWSFLTEFSAESRRYEGQDADVRLTPGFSWRRGRTVIRGAVTAGLSDGAPDLALQAGAVLLF